MRALAAFLLVAGLHAEIKDVTVAGATPTQAILTYTAPGDQPCQVAVSESQSLKPLVHDVDPALFAGANLDSRAGNANQGQRRVFVVGKRVAETAQRGGRVSRALQLATVHYFRISCGTEQATGTFTTANLAAGKAYPEIPLVDPRAPGEYAWPDMPYGDADPQMIDPLTGILFKPFTRPGEATDYWPYGGQTSHCSQNMVQGEYRCDLHGFLYAVNPANGRVRYLGRYGINMYIQVGGDDLGGSTCLPDAETFAPSHPEIFYCPAASKNGPVILEGKVSAKNAANGGAFADVAWRNVTPAKGEKGLLALARQFDGKFDTAVFKNPEVRGILGDGKLVIDFKQGGQDSPGWITVFDPAGPQFSAMYFTGAKGIHGCGPVLQSDTWVSVTFAGAGKSANWNYKSDPHGASVQDDAVPVQHAFTADKITAGSTGKGISVRRGANYAEILASPGKYAVGNVPMLGQSGIAYENFIENYTSQGPVAGEWVVNARPIEADNKITHMAKTGGQLYRAGMSALANGVAGSGGMRRKLFPTFAYCGSHPMKDVSGPKSVIEETAADSFKYCVAEAAGECNDASGKRATAPGEVYANCPGNDGATCTGAENNRGVCVMELGSFAGQISQISAATPQNPSGLDVRALTWGFKPFHISGGYFWSARTLADGSWILVNAQGYRRGADAKFLAKTPPPFTPDKVARDRFVPVPVTIPARAGATRAMVKFGYAENGDPGSFYCTSRQEACVAVEPVAQHTGQVNVHNGVITLASGDPFDPVTWKPGMRLQIFGVEWPLTAVTSAKAATIGSLTGAGTVTAAGPAITFSNPGECVKHPPGSRITANGTTVIVTDPWQCDGQPQNNRVGVNTAVSWSASAWKWDLGDQGEYARPYVSTFHYAGESYHGQPCQKGCTIQVPAISQRVLYYQIVYDNGPPGELQAVAVQ